MMEAVFGLLGVIIGSFITWFREERLEKRTRAERARYLAVQVICVLDEYIGKCIEVVQDDGTFRGQASHRNENGEEYYHTVVPQPLAPVYPDDVDWKSINSDLMYRILMLPNNARETDNSIQFVSDTIASPPDFDELYEARWEGYAELGLEAIAITDHLRETFKLPKKIHNKWNADWNPKKLLEEKLKEIEERRAKCAAVSAPIDNMMTGSKGENNDKN